MMGQQQQPEVEEVDVERERRRTLVLVNLASIMERADEALLPAVYREVGAALHATPTGLGALTLCRSAVQAACYPLAAYAAARHNRAHVIAAGAFLWAAATFLVAVSDTFLQVALARGLNGIGLALVVPSIQSLVADSTEDGTRGTAFGWLQLASSLGLISGGFVGLLLAQTTVFGIEGWRIAFHLVAIISVFVGVLNWFFAVDPHFPTSNAGTRDRLVSKQSAWQVVEEMIKEAKFVVQIPTFQIFVAQGVSGTFPWSALSFASMWLELIGFSHRDTAFLMTIFWVASSFGGLLGGKMGDFLAMRYPNAGRIVLSQISAGSAVPLAAVLLLGLPDDPSKGFAYGIVLFIMGVFISWNGPATNFPIFAEIVPEKSRTSIYALDRSFESVLASFAPPIVGILAQRVYGYRPDNKGQSVQLDRENAASLAKALYTSIAIPFTICTSIYSFLYCSYPRDRERARMQSLIESELQQMEQEGSCLEEGDCRFQVVDSPHDDEIATIEVTNDVKGLSETEKDTAKLLANRESANGGHPELELRGEEEAPAAGGMGVSAAATWEDRRTLVLVNLASIMERADEALLPAVYREVGAALHATPTGLGALTLCRSAVQAACYPVAAYAASRHNRAHVIAAGAFLWAAATFLVAVSGTFLQVAISRGLNGIGLALVIPAVQSLVADSTDDGNRGTAFGWLQLTSSIGSIIGGFSALLLASTTVLGVEGWRVAFHLVAAISVAVGVLVWLFAVDPHFAGGGGAPGGGKRRRRSAWDEARELVGEAKAVCRIPTFQIFVAQGVSGSFPWSALSFLSMWLELVGFSHGDTAVFTTVFAVATSLGALLGGKMGDALARRYPDAGRIVLSQISAGSAVPLAAVLLLALPDDPSTGVAHALVLFVMGLIISWNAAATNNPIFAEIVPEKSRTSIYALDRSFESILASFAPPAVGYFSQHVYGFKPSGGGGAAAAAAAAAAAGDPQTTELRHVELEEGSCSSRRGGGGDDTRRFELVGSDEEEGGERGDGDGDGDAGVYGSGEGEADADTVRLLASREL
uniref:Major facilitator superfamily (MFS) profile domain-containing protein n=1 Tax=Oryza punctata TaxID=4537 RepID=A0A0E0M0J2_ORYPU